MGLRTVENMATAPTLAEVEEHIVYEIEAMCRAAARYAEEVGATVNQATPSDWRDAVFFLEASLIHARNLVMLFGYPGKGERQFSGLSGPQRGTRQRPSPASATHPHPQRRRTGSSASCSPTSARRAGSHR